MFISHGSWGLVMSEIPRVEPPKPLVKRPRLLSSGGLLGSEWRSGRGYSMGEVKALGLSPAEARLLGIRVDLRRRTTWEVNVQRLREWLSKVARGEILPPDPAMPRHTEIKGSRGRIFRGLTPVGRRMRGLRSVGLRETHRYKWNRKIRERALRKRHEAARSKGGD
jgi:large subunit ribosomal protein L13e